MLTVPTTICWVCKAKFDLATMCMEHMRAVHTKVELVQTLKHNRLNGSKKVKDDTK